MTELLGGRYRLVERLGAGGMSVVWRGYDEVLGRQVAVKVLAARLAGGRAFRHRIRTEAQAAARLLHPNITNVYDYGEEDAVPYVVMELVDGQSLAERLGRDESLPWPEAVTACRQVADALAAAHARGVVHRDVTPGNVMLTATGAKVVDFGISALVGDRDIDADGSLLGTPAYLAPERLDGGQVSAAADVYALGLLLYRCLAGALPWPASSRTEILRAHLYQEPRAAAAGRRPAGRGRHADRTLPRQGARRPPDERRGRRHPRPPRDRDRRPHAGAQAPRPRCRRHHDPALVDRDRRAALVGPRQGRADRGTAARRPPPVRRGRCRRRRGRAARRHRRGVGDQWRSVDRGNARGRRQPRRCGARGDRRVRRALPPDRGHREGLQRPAHGGQRRQGGRRRVGRCRSTSPATRRSRRSPGGSPRPARR